MVKLRNRQFVYIIMRHDFTGNDIACASCGSPEQADNLKDEFMQEYLDRGFTEDECYFYVTSTVFYT